MTAQCCFLSRGMSALSFPEGCPQSYRVVCAGGRECCELWEQHPSVPLGAAETLHTFSALWFRFLDDHVSSRAGDWNDQQLGHSNFLHSDFKVTPISTSLGCCLVENIGAFYCQARFEKDLPTGWKFVSLWAREGVGEGFPGRIISLPVAKRGPLSFLMWMER